MSSAIVVIITDTRATAYLEEDKDTTEQESDSPQALFEKDAGADTAYRAECQLVNIEHTLWRLPARSASRTRDGCFAEDWTAVGVISEETETETESCTVSEQ